MKHLLYLAAVSLVAMLVFAPAAVAQDVDCPELSYEEAQAILASDPSDPNRLEADNDGEACEQNASSSPQPAPSPAPQPKEKEKEKSESSTESSKEGSKESYTKESTAEKQEQRKELPATGGSSLLLPAGALLLGSGLLVTVVLRRR